MDTLMHDDLARLIDVHAGRVLIADALSLLALSPGEARDLAAIISEAAAAAEDPDY
ncbi:MAG: hypothetical protein V9E98_15085 [Candidatus Nanopelagicales bacterium]